MIFQHACSVVHAEYDYLKILESRDVVAARKLALADLEAKAWAQNTVQVQYCRRPQCMGASTPTH